MRSSVFTVLLLLFAFVSCEHDPTAQDLPSLEGIKWKCIETGSWEDGTYKHTMFLHFRDEGRVTLREEYIEKTSSGIVAEEGETTYVYLYDFSVKQGVFIFEDFEAGYFELRGNLLFLKMEYNNVTYIFRRE